MRIGLSGKTLTLWTGGLDFLGLCAAGLEATGKHELVLLFPSVTLKGRARAFLGSCREWAKEFCQGRLAAWPHRRFPTPEVVASTLLGTLIDPREQVVCYPDEEQGLRDVVGRLRLEMVLPLMHPAGSQRGFHWLGYIPDVQHRRLPDFFSARERSSRDRLFQAILEQAPAVIVNSRDTANDLSEFYRVPSEKLFPLPFTPFPVSFLLGREDPQALARYDLPPRYFLISNQFWIHKSHFTAFEALRILHDRTGATDVQIVCTGRTEDYRFPGYFDDLKQKLNQLGIASSVRFLGFIPKVDQIALMRRSIAVVQPTLFEGGPGGGCVYEAVAIGAPAIVSDIPVNREIDDSGVTFFTASSAADLAEKMERSLAMPATRPELPELQARSRRRLLALGQALEHAIDFAMEAEPYRRR